MTEHEQHEQGEPAARRTPDAEEPHADAAANAAASAAGEPRTAETESSHKEAREAGARRTTAAGVAGTDDPSGTDDAADAADAAGTGGTGDEAVLKDGAEVNTGTIIETAGVPETAIPELVIISGMSGAGRSTAAKCLEDLGWFVVDNLPPALIPTMVELGARSQGNVARIAVVVDVRGRRFFDNLRESLADLETKNVTRRIVFLESSEDALVRRFESVRRPHPLQGDGRIVDGIAAERELLRELRGDADLVIDTSSLNVHELRAKMDAQFAGEEEPELRATVMSFGFKYGLPVDADLVADMRFLPNPHWVPELRQYTGLNEEVASYVFNQPGAKEFLDRYAELLHLIRTGYRREGKRYVTIAVGCTGGKHRSVAMSERLAARLVSEGVETVVVHRDMGRE
ncbi:RNase adapter RapZ [Streptomyces aurantiacus]|uniref:RNase adapter RapZ n=1 Tax=Streptomyces aurantiacus TaxID=47760 RepID=UPI0006E12DD9